MSDDAVTPGVMTPGVISTPHAAVGGGPPTPHTPVPTSSPRTPSPVWEMLLDPHEQGQDGLQELPLYVTAGNIDLEASEVAPSGADFGTGAPDVHDNAVAQPLGASLVVQAVEGWCRPCP